jgi:hypothetical protein
MSFGQWLGAGQNLDVRDRIARGRSLTKALRSRLASQHIPYMTEVM